MVYCNIYMNFCYKINRVVLILMYHLFRIGIAILRIRRSHYCLILEIKLPISDKNIFYIKWSKLLCLLVPWPIPQALRDLLAWLIWMLLLGRWSCFCMLVWFSPQIIFFILHGHFVYLMESQLVEANNKEIIKAPHCWPLVRGINQWTPLTKGQ